MSNELGIGKIIVSKQHRDAIHVAVVPAVSSCDVKPGEWVRLVSRGQDGHGRVMVAPDNADDAAPLIGIADPFVSVTIRRGIGFWVMLFPDTATGLRHEYTHPLLDGGEG
jgi:hypothetical protein